MKVLFALLLCIFICFSGKAQTFSGCVDSSRIQLGPACPIEVNPVCGCNKKTYVNLCYLQAAGVTTYTQEPCEPLYLYVYPSLVTQGTLTAQVFVKGPPVNVRVYIMDLYGKLYMNQLYQSLPTSTFNYYLNDLRPGMYLVIAESSTFWNARKIVVPEIF